MPIDFTRKLAMDLAHLNKKVGELQERIKVLEGKAIPRTLKKIAGGKE